VPIVNLNNTIILMKKAKSFFQEKGILGQKSHAVVDQMKSIFFWEGIRVGLGKPGHNFVLILVVLFKSSKLLFD
jgi:hypothetical protein